MRRAAALAALGIAVPAGAAILSAAPANAATAPTRTLAGSCSFSGPITPKPPITIVPKPGAHFDYAGTGSCDGTFAGAAVQKLLVTVTFTNVATAFDTCELGPDFNLRGVLAVVQGTVTANFPITINLARLALFGPLSLTTPGGGNAFGTATFTPANAAQALVQCGSTGISTATLSGRFTTTSPLVGTVVTPPPQARRKRATRRHHARKHASRPHP